MLMPIHAQTTQGQVLWCFGLSGAGKTTLCALTAQHLRFAGRTVIVLDADDMRKGLCSDLGYDITSRFENIRRLAHVAKFLSDNQITVLVAAITPLENMRSIIREIIPRVRLVFVDAPLEICEARDVKGFYALARAGLIDGFTGITSLFELPVDADGRCDTVTEELAQAVDKLLTTKASAIGIDEPLISCDLATMQSHG